jgi:hypothetical protein
MRISPVLQGLVLLMLVITALSDEDIASYEFGSKVELVAWYSYTALIWALKGTMLCFFHRMTTGLWQHRLVKWISYVCVASYVAVFLTVSRSHANSITATNTKIP